jgi:hypothetical protein
MITANPQLTFHIIIIIQHTWNVKSKVIPVITEATETISKSFRQYHRNTPRKPESRNYKKTATVDTAHILRKVLM